MKVLTQEADIQKLIDSIDQMMADLAFINHWRFEDMEAMPLEELRRFHRLAVERASKLWQVKQSQ